MKRNKQKLEELIRNIVEAVDKVNGNNAAIIAQSYEEIKNNYKSHEAIEDDKLYKQLIDVCKDENWKGISTSLDYKEKDIHKMFLSILTFYVKPKNETEYSKEIEELVESDINGIYSKQAFALYLNTIFLKDKEKNLKKIKTFVEKYKNKFSKSDLELLLKSSKLYNVDVTEEGISLNYKAIKKK